jgi:hypothetical protein
MQPPAAEPYVDGSEAIGLSMISREPEKERDVSPV